MSRFLSLGVFSSDTCKNFNSIFVIFYISPRGILGVSLILTIVHLEINQNC